MKHTIAYLIISAILCGNISCTLPEQKGQDNAQNSKLDAGAETALSVLEPKEDKIDSSLLRAAQKAERIKRQEEIVQRVTELKERYQQIEGEEGTYVEEVPLNSFLGKVMESGALEINKIGEQYLRIHADYFDGEPKGGKVFFIENGNLMAVEILQLIEKITENGTIVTDKVTHLFYYEDDSPFRILDYQNKTELEFQTISWEAENIADWDIVKEYLGLS